MGNTEEDLEAASTLLSLSDTLEDTLDEGDENALLMPIGGTNVPEDVTPQPLRLDQVSVDNAILPIFLEDKALQRSAAESVGQSLHCTSIPVRSHPTHGGHCQWIILYLRWSDTK